jgi:dTDP-4-dehydrorhamnose reductase
MKKILVTGSNGLLGQNLVNKLQENNTYILYGVSRGENRNEKGENFIYFNIDLTNEKELSELINELQPQFIINTAAMTNVDTCELNKEACDEINVDVVKYLVELCELNDIHLIHLSTDFIFDGEKGYYKESDPANPVNYYGVSKLRSEKSIINSNIKYTILRTILVFGITNELKNNIVLWVKNSIEKKQQINIVTDQLRMPTFVDDLVYACLYAIDNGVEGIFNVSSNTLLSIYDMAIEIANTFHLDKSFINPIPTSLLNQPAKRPFKTGFDLSRSFSQLNLPSHSFSENLQVFKNQLASYDGNLD